jgi:hypothetical protein
VRGKNPGSRRSGARKARTAYRHGAGSAAPVVSVAREGLAQGDVISIGVPASLAPCTPSTAGMQDGIICLRAAA